MKDIPKTDSNHVNNLVPKVRYSWEMVHELCKVTTSNRYTTKSASIVSCYWLKSGKVTANQEVNWMGHRNDCCQKKKKAVRANFSLSSQIWLDRRWNGKCARFSQKIQLGSLQMKSIFEKPRSKLDYKKTSSHHNTLCKLHFVAAQ